MLIKQLKFYINTSSSPIKTLNALKPVGKLTILPTPIGNLQDLTPNIIKSLFKADVIGCQDRRVAGKLYTLIKSRNILQSIVNNFGDIGLSSLIPFNQQKAKTQEQQNYLYYNYSNMNDKARNKFLRKMDKEAQKKFKIDYLKYRALKIMKNQDQFVNKDKDDKFDQLYGLQTSDLQHIELQIKNARIKKGRGLLIPLNTYSQTKMFNMVRMFLQTKNVAIISDAGMPCISDPGWKMVRRIKQTHPQIQIQVIGGPSSVSLMTLLASMSVKQQSNSLSGRFQGFAPQEVSHMKDNTIEIQQAKKNEFSIHFINSKKLRKKGLQLEKLYGQKQKVFLANQLTKMYERRYHGTLGELNSQMSKEESQFDGIGQLSYLIYPKDDIKDASLKNQIQLQAQTIKQKQIKVSLPRLSLISIHNFIDSIKKAQNELLPQALISKKGQKQVKSTEDYPQARNNKRMSSKDMIELLCSIFGIKTSEARKYVYQKDIQIKHAKFGKNNSLNHTQVISKYKQEQQKDQNTGASQRKGRKINRKKEPILSPEQQELLRQLENRGNMF